MTLLISTLLHTLIHSLTLIFMVYSLYFLFVSRILITELFHHLLILTLLGEIEENQSALIVGHIKKIIPFYYYHI